MSAALLVDAACLRRFPLPCHPDDDDKEGRGVALVVAGSREVPGAALLAGTAALRAGAGKLQIATARSAAIALGVAMPEARIIGLDESEDGGIAAAAVAGLVAQCDAVDSLTIGPGLQPGAGLEALVAAVLASAGSHPLVLDAAALGTLPALAEKLRGWGGGATLLPHAGEMARLLDCDAEAVRADPLAAAREAADRFGAVALVKGEWSFIVAPGGAAFRFHGGGVGLATSGSGDTLAGIVGGLCARGADPLTATLWGVHLHGEAGRLLAERVGRIGFLAREIPDLVPGLMAP